MSQDYIQTSLFPEVGESKTQEKAEKNLQPKTFLTLTQMMQVIWEKDEGQLMLIIRALLGMHLKKISNSEVAKIIYLKLMSAEIALKTDHHKAIHLVQDAIMMLQKRHT